MGFFSKIMDKLGFDAGNRKVAAMVNKPVAAPAASAGTPTASAGAGPAAQAAPVAPIATATGSVNADTAMATAVAERPVQTVDVAAQLEQKAASNSQKLNWRTSIVDLLKLLDIDSSLQARKELATELGCPPDLMNDSAKMNMWLHKAVMQQLAANGGKVPAELLD
jgi:hypothetical protein